MKKKEQFDPKKQRRFVNDALQNGIPVNASITIEAPPEKIYEFWRDAKNLPKFLTQLSEITEKNSRVSSWKWKALKGAVEIIWESEITADHKPDHLSWRSLEGAQIAHAGEILLHYLPEKHATEVRVHLDYAPPGGKVTDFIANIFGEAPATVLQNDLRRFRQLIEVGYLCTIEGQPKGNTSESKNTSESSKKEQK
jgi:uncharacterized membrane protein